MWLNYRKDLDGLRAFAVLFVIFFHLFPETFKGGFLGVDIFFVISGYVISLKIYQQILGKNFSLKDFYIRRFKRLYPALVFVVLTTLVCICIFSPHFAKFDYFFRSGLFSIIALSNYFYIKVGDDYFLTDSLNPFNHTWSLAIEEQFYLVYPFLILILAFLSSKTDLLKNIIRALSVLLILSLAIAVFLSAHPSGNYYSPLARAWEFCAGCLSFYFSLYIKPNLSRKSSNAVFLIGLSLIVCAIARLHFVGHSRDLFLSMTPVVAGVVCIIASGWNKTGESPSKILNSRISIYIGQLSYSLYLWHLPVIFFGGIILLKSSPQFSATVLAITFCLSILTHHFLENPLRTLKIDASRARHKFLIFITLIVGTPVLIAILILITPVAQVRAMEDYLIQKIKLETREYNYFEQYRSRLAPYNSIQYGSITHRCALDNSNAEIDQLFKSCSVSNEASQKSIFLLGDSHAFHFIPSFMNLPTKDFDFHVLTKGCLFVPGISFKAIEKVATKQSVNKLDPKRWNVCLEFTDKLLENVIAFPTSKQKYAFISTRYDLYLPEDFAKRDTQWYFNEKKLASKDILPSIERNLLELAKRFETNNIKLIFIAPTPTSKFQTVECLLPSKKEACSFSREEDIKKRKPFLDMLTRVTAQHSNTYIWDPYFLICKDDTCKNIADDFIWFSDEDHLSREGAEYLASDLERFIKTIESRRHFN